MRHEESLCLFRKTAIALVPSSPSAGSMMGGVFGLRISRGSQLEMM